VVRRSAYLTESDTAFRMFEEHYEFLRECYKEFFPEVYNMSKQLFDELINKS
jgi:hypothetical protein